MIANLPNCPLCNSARLNIFSHSRFVRDHIVTIPKVQCMDCGCEAPAQAWCKRDGIEVAPDNASLMGSLVPKETIDRCQREITEALETALSSLPVSSGHSVENEQHGAETTGSSQEAQPPLQALSSTDHHRCCDRDLVFRSMGGISAQEKRRAAKFARCHGNYNQRP